MKAITCGLIPAVPLAFVLPAKPAPIISGTLFASLNTGSLSGTIFPVSFSYDKALVDSSGFGPLNSFDFTLLGTSFSRANISQGGQVILQSGTLTNITASFQGVLPPGAQVNNITFGFGGPGIIGYIDRSGNFGLGSFTFTAPVPEPGPAALLAAAIFMLCGVLLFRPHHRY